MISVEFRKNLNEVLRLIAIKLDLNETRYRNAVEKYENVAKWLNGEDSKLADHSPAIYPQGSFSLGTIVKPIGSDEYDIDLVCELKDFLGAPDEIKSLVGNRLQENGIYQPRLEEMNRCWRLYYAKEFHLDILPAKPSLVESLSNTAIEVPDRDLQDWSDSDPKGFTEWFKDCMVEQFTINRQILAQLKQKSVDDVPEYAVKTTLQQAVQLLKRNRDININKDKDKPISIIITTLAGHAYENQADLYETLIALVRDMPNKIDYKDGVAWVHNPVNPEENFAEKWEKHPQRHKKLIEWLSDLESKLRRLQKFNDIGEAKSLVESLFGENVSQAAMEELSKQKSANAHIKVTAPPTIKIDDPIKPWKE